jgi:hypothetical protein
VARGNLTPGPPDHLGFGVGGCLDRAQVVCPDSVRPNPCHFFASRRGQSSNARIAQSLAFRRKNLM